MLPGERYRMGVTLGGPAPDQVEVSVFGPGYGESSVIHIGANNWIIIDSCVDAESKQPASLQYLRSIGVDPSAVKLVIITHWHDDHIRGISSIVAKCSEARVCVSAALSRREFLASALPYDERPGIVVGSGASEISKVLEIIRLQKRPAIRAFADKKLMALPPGDTGHGLPCEIWALSPSDEQFDRSLKEVAKLVPKVRATKIRAPDQGPNHLSVVTWVSVGDQIFLFGADLEEHSEPLLGWSAILNSTTRPPGQAFFFKIPHHGSSNGHHDRVWSELLIANADSVLTPWNRNEGLPTKEDVYRICNLTNSAFSTSNCKAIPTRRRSPMVEKQIKETTVGKLQNALSITGQLRIRSGGNGQPKFWCIETLAGACTLSSLAC
jgi:hypothetical protein